MSAIASRDDRSAVGDDHLAVMPHPRPLAFDQEDIAGTSGERVLKQRMDLRTHGGTLTAPGGVRGRGKAEVPSDR